MPPIYTLAHDPEVNKRIRSSSPRMPRRLPSGSLSSGAIAPPLSELTDFHLPYGINCRAISLRVLCSSYTVPSQLQDEMSRHLQKSLEGLKAKWELEVNIILKYGEEKKLLNISLAWSLVAFQNTRINIQYNTAQQLKDVLGGTVAQFQVDPSSPIYITASQGVQVIYFCPGSAPGALPAVAPFMMGIADTGTYCFNYTFTAMPSPSFCSSASPLVEVLEKSTMDVHQVSSKESAWLGRGLMPPEYAKSNIFQATLLPSMQ
ncbi:UNVERIFIED_CONTAM: hypothetical protein FKN15_045713 [Acipenser sinensis]